MSMATAEEVAPGFVADEPEEGGNHLNHLQKKQLFDQADRNQDKKLDIDELAGMVKALEERNMKDTVDDLIKVADDNKDQKLALSEIIKHVDDFGGHMAGTELELGARAMSLSSWQVQMPYGEPGGG
jgi:Ca2+-binding protein (EF-Hand superfamily)